MLIYEIVKLIQWSIFYFNVKIKPLPNFEYTFQLLVSHIKWSYSDYLLVRFWYKLPMVYVVLKMTLYTSITSNTLYNSRCIDNEFGRFHVLIDIGIWGGHEDFHCDVIQFVKPLQMSPEWKHNFMVDTWTNVPGNYLE